MLRPFRIYKAGKRASKNILEYLNIGSAVDCFSSSLILGPNIKLSLELPPEANLLICRGRADVEDRGVGSGEGGRGVVERAVRGGLEMSSS